MGKLKVINGGMLSTIQDEGRFGLRQYGIPQSGAMDKVALNQANFLVGNELSYPAIEMAMNGLTVEVKEATIVAVTGAKAELSLNGSHIEMNTSYQLEEGDIIKIGACREGVYSYLGLSGLLAIDKVFSSYSTYLLAGFGGFEGRPLKKGDCLITSGMKFKRREITESKLQKFPKNPIIRFLAGPEINLIEQLEGKTFQIDSASNRFGIRLSGNQVKCQEQEIVSSAVIPGTIQLPSSGEPIILMNDCQTTGGYPRIGKVIDSDLGRLAQLSAGSKVRFKQVTLEEALSLKQMLYV